MPWNDGRNRLRRWANKVFRLLPPYSMPLSSQRTLKLISVGLLATPSSSINSMKRG